VGFAVLTGWYLQGELMARKKAKKTKASPPKHVVKGKGGKFQRNPASDPKAGSGGSFESNWKEMQAFGKRHAEMQSGKAKAKKSKPSQQKAKADE
jgi:hypothetical protein